jgi:hypothetical protein
MRLVTDREYEVLQKFAADQSAVASWQEHPLTGLLLNTIRRIPASATVTPQSTAAEQALVEAGATRMREAVMNFILDPSVQAPVKAVEFPEATYTKETR